MKFQTTIRGLTALLALTLIAGCGATPSDSAVPDVNITITGRVIDRTTRAAITDATIEVRAGEKAFVATFAKNETDTTLFNEAQHFTVEVPLVDLYDLRISKSGYATYRNVFAPTVLGGATLARSINVGDIPMALGFDLAVYVVDGNTGRPVQNATVYAVPTNFALEDTVAAELNLGGNLGFEISATTASDGLATLSGLNYLIDYTVVAPAFDSDGDGDYDYTTSVQAMAAQQTVFPKTTTIALAPAGNTTALAVVAQSSSQFGGTAAAGTNPALATPISGDLFFVFNLPVNTADVTLALNRDGAFVPGGIFTGAAALDFDGDTVVDTGTDIAVSASLSAGGTILTINPDSDLTVNGLYSLNAVLSYFTPGGIGGVDSTTTLLSAVGGAPANFTVYAFANDDTTVTAPTADNYNADDDGVAAVAVCLEFDEVVYGTATVLATTAAGVTTFVTNPVAVALTGGSLVNEGDNAAALCGAVAGCPSDTDGACAVTDAIKYIVPLAGTTSADNTAASVNSVTVLIDAVDYADNVLNTELTLRVH